MKRDLAIRALKMSVAPRSPSRGCIFHSDRGDPCLGGAIPRVRRQGDDPAGDYASGWIWAELGLQEHRN